MGLAVKCCQRHPQDRTVQSPPPRVFTFTNVAKLWSCHEYRRNRTGTAGVLVNTVKTGGPRTFGRGCQAEMKIEVTLREVAHLLLPVCKGWVCSSKWKPLSIEDLCLSAKGMCHGPWQGLHPTRSGPAQLMGSLAQQLLWETQLSASPHIISGSKNRREGGHQAELAVVLSTSSCDGEPVCASG